MSVGTQANGGKFSQLGRSACGRCRVGAPSKASLIKGRFGGFVYIVADPSAKRTKKRIAFCYPSCARAENETRTRDPNLGKVVLYQLSYFRKYLLKQMLFRTLSGKRDSNSRPQPWQGCALPTELFPHFLTLQSKVTPNCECKDIAKNFISKTF